MLVLARFTIFFMMISSLLIYLFTNIKLIGEGSPALVVLAFSVLLGGLLIVLELLLKQNIYIKKSFLVLILFFTYFIVFNSFIWSWLYFISAIFIIFK